MTKYEELMQIKNNAETDGRLGKISVEAAQKIVADTERVMGCMTIEELSEEVQ